MAASLFSDKRLKENIEKLLDGLSYLENEIIEPQKLQNMINELIILPPYINIIVSRMVKRNSELFDTNYRKFAKLYMYRKVNK